MIGWLFTPGRRWWQIARLALGVADDLKRARQQGRGH